MHGMQYQLLQNIEGVAVTYTASFTNDRITELPVQVHFREDKAGLVIRRSDSAGHVGELIPHSRLTGDIPRYLATAFIHWLYRHDHDDGWSLEFRLHNSSWSSIDIPWSMICSNNQCRLYGKDRTDVVLDLRSVAFAAIFSVLSRLEASKLDILATSSFSPPAKVIVQLPRFGLTFFVNDDGMMECREISRAIIPHNQIIGTLYGLRSGLVLQDRQASFQRLLIPYGEIGIGHGNHGHSVVDITPYVLKDRIRYFMYDIDTILGRLTEDGSLTGRLYLIYLHAVTSLHTRDTLTSKRGM
jgi:hypothetical protein